MCNLNFVICDFYIEIADEKRKIGNLKKYGPIRTVDKHRYNTLARAVNKRCIMQLASYICLVISPDDICGAVAEWYKASSSGYKGCEIEITLGHQC